MVACGATRGVITKTSYDFLADRTATQYDRLSQQQLSFLLYDYLKLDAKFIVRSRITSTIHRSHFISDRKRP